MRPYRADLTRALGVLVVLALVALTARLLLVLFAGVLFAVVLRGAARRTARWTRTPYLLDLVVVVLVVLGGLTGLFVAFVPRLAEELGKLPQTVPVALDHVTRALHLDAITRQGDAKGTAAVAPEKLFSGAVVTAHAGLEVLAGMIVVFFVGVYGAAEPGSYARVLLSVVPSSERARTERALDDASAELERWLLGRLVAMLFVAVTTAVAFAFLKLPLALPLALLAGLLTFVEYVGAIASAIPAILFGLTEGALTAVWVGSIFTALHVVEGYVLTPLLAKNTVRIPPAYGLASQVILGALVGPLGLTFSTPLLVVGTTLYRGFSRRERSVHA